MGKISFMLMASLAMLLYSCSSGSSVQNTADTTASQQAVSATVAYDASLPKGSIADSVICKDNSQTYALYLPSSYTSDRSFPCIFFFDAHARGALPLRMYQKLAERYGIVFVGSNASRNGISWDETNNAIKALMQDVRTRINIDPKRVYTAGFSGGSRVASSVAIMDGGVAGVIGCAAGFPGGSQPQNKFDHFGMVGNEDFNLSEMVQLDGMLEQNGFTHQLLIFNGIHGWPPLADFQMAILWLQVNAMKEHLEQSSDTLVTALKAEYDKRITAAKSTGDLLDQQTMLAGLVKILDGLADVTQYKKDLAILDAADELKQAVALQQQLQQYELGQQQDLMKEFSTHDEKWWADKISELSKKSHTPKAQDAKMNRRLVNYVGLVAYLNTNHAIQTGNLQNAATYLKIFKMADPKNPDVSYLSAVYSVKKGDDVNALKALEQAASLGYTDVGQLTTDPSFSGLKENGAFITIVNKVRTNSTK